ncbi:transposase [bacterium]|nr:transposase [bacterium]
MENLKQWIHKHFDQKNVEPNSSLGKAFNYMLRHWDPLTRFLEIPRCPLDNNIVERCLKSAILHRKNSLFYKTQFGAHAGDIFMSIIQTCNLAKINTFEYLTEILKNPHKVFKNPDLWMPWNYQTAQV